MIEDTSYFTTMGDSRISHETSPYFNQKGIVPISPIGQRNSSYVTHK